MTTMRTDPWRVLSHSRPSRPGPGPANPAAPPVRELCPTCHGARVVGHNHHHGRPITVPCWCALEEEAS
jgi:hypothetical protein